MSSEFLDMLLVLLLYAGGEVSMLWLLSHWQVYLTRASTSLPRITKTQTRRSFQRTGLTLHRTARVAVPRQLQYRNTSTTSLCLDSLLSATDQYVLSKSILDLGATLMWSEKFDPGAA